MLLKIITTEDGSHSLLHEELKETYHSTRGARGESLHVFIKEGLETWSRYNETSEIKILEVGLGTGLNAFLSANWAKANQRKIYFTSLEPFPIQKEVYENLNYFVSAQERALFLAIHDAKWEKTAKLTSNFELLKTASTLEKFITSSTYNLIFFDAFAPSKQPEVWSNSNLKKCYSWLEKKGFLTTYCAQGQFKRNLKEVGFSVETLQGAMGKKEMVRAVKKLC